MSIFQVQFCYICNKYIPLKYYFLFSSLLCYFSLFAQEELVEPAQVVDSLYREDQLYVGLTFNLLGNKPTGFSQNGLSAGVQAGFIRDFPINKKRNKAFGLGVGIAIDIYNQNLFINNVESANGGLYTILDDDSTEEVNRFTTYTLEFPLEYRWRTSTPTEYGFWRIHAGIKIGYLFNFKSTFEDGDNVVVQTDIPELNNLQYGPSFSFGYGAFNFQGYYGLNTLFNEEATVDGEDINLQVIRLGLIFYFL